MPTPNAIQIARYSEVLRSLLSIEGKAPAAEIATEIFPGLVLENDRPEWAALGGTRFAFGRVSGLNAVGVISCVLINPAGSGQMLIVRYARGNIHNTSGAVGNLDFGIGSAANVTTPQPTLRFLADTRFPPSTNTARPVGLLGTFNGVNVLGQKDQIGVPNLAGNANACYANVLFKGPLVIAPGFAAAVQWDVANVTLRASFDWYERPMQESERLASTL